jgi:hypothetical protein
MRSLALLVVLFAGCNDRPLEPAGDLGARDGGDMSARPDVDLAGANACEQRLGYCAMGDFVQPMCKVGFTESPAITATGVCGLGICCVPLEH